MTIVFSQEAKDTLEEISEFVESLNTEGSGLRFYNRFISKITDKFLPNLSYPLCKNKWLAELNLQCVNIDGKWIVAFQQQKDQCIIYYIIHGSVL